MSELASNLFEELPITGNDAQPDWLDALRQRGRAQFQKSGLPTKRVEQWKYTSLFTLEQLNPALGDAIPDSESFGLLEPLADLASRVSLIDGALASMQGVSLPGLRIWSLSDALEDESLDIQAVLESLDFDQKGQGFSALNTAMLGNGVVIHVEKGTHAGEVLLQWNQGAGQDNALFNSRVVILLEVGASLHLVEQFENTRESSILNVVTQGRLAKEANLTLTRVQQQSSSSFLFTRTDVKQSGDSRFQFTALDLGDGLVRHDVKAELAGPGAFCALNGACITSGQSHVDHHLEAAHMAKDCQSSQLFRAVANDRSRVVFNGKVHVYEGADGTDASQSSAGLLLSKLAEIDAKPELEIYADEVIASHGATVGQLDEEALFYLRSRGLSPDDARNLLTRAFCRHVTDQLPVEALREPLGDRLTRSLSRHG